MACSMCNDVGVMTIPGEATPETVPCWCPAGRKINNEDRDSKEAKYTTVKAIRTEQLREEAVSQMKDENKQLQG